MALGKGAQVSPRGIDPLIRPLVDVVTAVSPPAQASIIEARRASDNRSSLLIGTYYQGAPTPATVSDQVIDVEGGAVNLRVYRPSGHPPFPAHLYIHGGAFWLGSVNSSDIPCRELCVRAGAVVVSVGYRLAPEHTFPTAPEDCYAALCWVSDNSRQLDVDASRISVGGESAGGNLAAAVSLIARDRGRPSIVLQVLGIPCLDLTLSQPSMNEFAVGYMLTKQALIDSYGLYLVDRASAVHPYASPLLAPDLAGLPPTLIMTMEFDPLRDEGEAFARRLIESGVPTHHRRWLGHVHGSALFTRLLPSARSYRDLMVETLRRAHSHELMSDG